MIEIAAQPAILNHAGPIHEGLSRPTPPSNSPGQSEAEQQAAKRLYFDQSLEVMYRMIVNKRAPDFYKAMQFRKTTSGALLQAADSLLVDGEALYLAMIVELEKEWDELPQVKGSNVKYPFQFSEQERQEILSDADGALEGQRAMEALYRSMGDLWPEKGLVRHEQYEDAIESLAQLREQIIAHYAQNAEQVRLWHQSWPFHDLVRT